VLASSPGREEEKELEPMTRKMWMKEGEIQDLEKLDEAQMGAFIMQTGTQKSADKLVALLRSYRIAAMVANSAWKVMKESQSGQITPASWTELQQRLNLYSPGNFPPFRSDLEFLCRSLEELYDWLSPHNHEGGSTMVIMEKLFERIDSIRKTLYGE
jgi:hypothetical protein